MATEEDIQSIEDISKKLAETRPELKKAVDDLLSKKKEMEKLLEIDSTSDAIIDGVPVRITVYKRALVAIQFRDIEEAKKAITKITT